MEIWGTWIARQLGSCHQFNIQFYLLPAHFFIDLFCNARVSAAKGHQQKTIYFFKKHSGVPWTEIATLKRVFFLEPFGVDGGVNPLGT